MSKHFSKVITSAVLLALILPAGIVPTAQASTLRTVTWTSNADFNGSESVTDLVVNNDRLAMGGDTYSVVSTARYHTLAIKTDGTLWAWGDNTHGQLGLGNTDTSSSPQQVGEANNWQKVFATENENSFGIKDDGTLWAWGRNGASQLGLGDADVRLAPTQVGSDVNWSNVVSSGQHSIGLKSNGTIWSWGNGFLGRLGHGDTDDKVLPTQIGIDTTWAVISAGDQSSHAIKSDGTLWSWGDNGDGNLGTGDTDERLSPTKIGEDQDWENIATSNRHSLAIKNDGSLWSWGWNGDGQLGHNDYNDRNLPTRVGGDYDWEDISVGQYHSTAVKSNGTMWVMGYNSANQLGIGDEYSDAMVPVQINASTSWLKPSVGGSQSMALKYGNELWVWGDNTYGKLGLGDSDQRIYPTRVGGLDSGTATYIYDAEEGNVATWQSLSWISDPLSADDSIAFRIRTSSDNVVYSDWSESFTQDEVSSTTGTASLTGLTASRYAEIEVTLTAGTGSPQLLSFQLEYTLPSPAVDTPTPRRRTSGGGGGGAPVPPPSVVANNSAFMELFNKNRDLFLTAQSMGITLPPAILALLNSSLPVQVGAPSTPNTPNTPVRNLTIGASGNDVRLLQQLLNTLGFNITNSGPGSAGNETTTFGPLTRDALIKYQTSNGISPASGLFGPLTRAKMKSLNVPGLWW